MNCAILGAGYVGTPLAAVLAFYNPTINFYVVDINKTLIERWKNLDYPFIEKDLAKYVESTINKNLFFTTDSQSVFPLCNKFFICVNTSTKESGKGKDFAPDMSSVFNCVQEICVCYASMQKIDKPIIIIEKSTVPFKTSEIIEKIIEREFNKDFEKINKFTVLSNPEFLAACFLIIECNK